MTLEELFLASGSVSSSSPTSELWLWSEARCSAHEAARSGREWRVLSLRSPLWSDGVDAASSSAYEVLRWCRGVTGDSAWKVHAVIHSCRIGILCSHCILSWEARVLCLVRCIPVYSIYKHKTNMEFLPCHPLWSWWGQNELFCRPSAYYGCFNLSIKVICWFFSPLDLRHLKTADSSLGWAERRKETWDRSLRKEEIPF